KIGIDPTDFRKKNLLRRGELVAEGAPPMDADYLEMMDKAAGAINWDGHSSMEPQSRSDSSSLALPAKGRALVLTLRNGNQGGGRAYGMATVAGCGNGTVPHNAPDPGQGIYNLISIIAAKTLELPRSQIIVGEPDTAVSLPFSGVNAQRTTIQLGNAVKNACENLKQELVNVACEIKGGNPSEWRVADGRLWRAEQSFSFGDIAAGIKTLGD